MADAKDPSERAAEHQEEQVEVADSVRPEVTAPGFEGISPEDATGKSRPRSQTGRKFTRADALARPSRFGTSRPMMAAALHDVEDDDEFTEAELVRRVKDMATREVDS